MGAWGLGGTRIPGKFILESSISQISLFSQPLLRGKLTKLASCTPSWSYGSEGTGAILPGEQLKVQRAQETAAANR